MAVETFQKFVSSWVHPDYRPAQVLPEALDRAEARFETYLPRSYRECMINVGPASTSLSLLSTIVDRRLDIPDIHDFLTPEELIETTRNWRDCGLPENMIAFATTAGGDLYCFEQVPEAASVPEDAIVWYFDHEERVVESLDLPFAQWIALYASIRNPPPFTDA